MRDELRIDEGVVVKLEGARIELERGGANLIAEGSPHELISSLGAEHVLEFTAAIDNTDEALDWLGHIHSVEKVDHKDQQFRMTVSEPHTVLPTLFSGLSERQTNLTSLTTRHASLEDVFVELTGRQFEEDEVQD